MRRCEFLTVAGSLRLKMGRIEPSMAGAPGGCGGGETGHSSGRGQAGRRVQEAERTVERSQDEREGGRMVKKKAQPSLPALRIREAVEAQRPRPIRGARGSAGRERD